MQQFLADKGTRLGECLPVDSYSDTRFAPVDGSVNFTGRLAREVIRITDPRSTSYLDQMSCWYDLKTKNEIVSIKMFEKLERTVGSWGLTGLDRLLCFMIVQELQNFISFLSRRILKDKVFLELFARLTKELDPVTGLVGQPQKVYGQAAVKVSKIMPPFLDAVLKVGQMQLLRRQIAHQLNTSCKFDSKFLASALSTMNDALLTDIERHYQDPSLPYPKDDNPLMSELTCYLESAGISNPLTKIYITTNKLDYLPLVIFLFVTSYLPKLVYMKSVGELICKKTTEPLDGAPFVAGTITLLKQFHSENTDQFFALVGQYVRSMIASTQGVPQPDITSDVTNALLYLDNYIYYAGLSRKMTESHIPTYILDQYRSQVTT